MKFSRARLIEFAARQLRFRGRLLAFGLIAAALPPQPAAAQHDATPGAQAVQRNPFGIIAHKPLRAAQLAPVPYDPANRVDFKMDVITLKGEPEHYLQNFELTLHLSQPDDREAVEQLRGELQNYLTGEISGKSILELNQLAEKMRLRETILLFLNEHLNQAVVCDVFITRYLLK